MTILTILPNADPILAIHALADPPPGVDVRAPIDSIKFLTLLLNRGPSVLAPILYLENNIRIDKQIDRYNILNNLLLWFEMRDRIES